MKNSFGKLVSDLGKIANQFDSQTTDIKMQLLKKISSAKFTNTNTFLAYHDILLFILAHPENRAIESAASDEMARLTKHLKNPSNSKNALFVDSGLPFTEMTTRYSHDLMRDMVRNGWKISIDSYDEAGTALNELLKITLPSIIREETTADLNNDEILDQLKINSKDRFNFLLNEFSKLDSSPYLKDHLWQSMQIFLNIDFHKAEQSKSYNRFLNSKIFYQNDLLKKFDHTALLNSKLPAPSKLSEDKRDELIAVIRNSMIQTLRETDTSTYMDENSLRLLELERGISVVIYGMKPNRQLPIQSYIGYTLFKNGFPAAYGGSWIFGHNAKFGLNVFEAFRGGESGYILCQLLRVYKQTFGLNYIEIDAYQFGKDNMDGIRSGAYWFYYRYGFRSLDKKLDKIASKEYSLIKSKPGYRTNEKTLIALAESNIALNPEGTKAFEIDKISGKVLALIQKKFKGDTRLAVEICVSDFCQRTNLTNDLNPDQLVVLEEVALFAAAYQLDKKSELEILKKMVFTKAGSPYEYNKLVTALLS